MEQIAEVLKPKSSKREDFIKECKSGAFDGAVAAFRTFPSVSITGRIDEELVPYFPLSMKFLCHNGNQVSIAKLYIVQYANTSYTGAGYDQIDIAPCTKRGIRVSNVPTAVDDATADVNMFLIIGALRNFNVGMMALRRNEWRGKNTALGHDPEGKVLGILGMGGIGRNLKRKAEAFSMKTQYHNRKRLPEDQEDGAKYVSFDELLATSDVISLNLPLNVSPAPRLSEVE